MHFSFINIYVFNYRSYAEFHATSSNRFQRSPSVPTPSPSPSSVPESRHSAPQAVMTIEEFVSQPGRTHIQMLHPEERNGATWY